MQAKAEGNVHRRAVPTLDLRGENCGLAVWHRQSAGCMCLAAILQVCRGPAVPCVTGQTDDTMDEEEPPVRVLPKDEGVVVQLGEGDIFQ